ncbi:MAG TPA: hypothetical protein VED59_01570 [Acidimicrobiales bacterium]|nr:hypothetical protein [Acidimicrobiales bacterium]
MLALVAEVHALPAVAARDVEPTLIVLKTGQAILSAKRFAAVRAPRFVVLRGHCRKNLPPG